METFRYDATGIDPDAPDFPLIPDGWFPFRIMETEAQESSKGNPMVLAKCKCIDPRHSDCGMVWHFVVFIPKGKPGDKMNVHFRKSIGVPWEGDVVIDPVEWVGKTFMGKVITEEYKGKPGNKFKEISPIRDVPPAEEESPFNQ